MRYNVGKTKNDRSQQPAENGHADCWPRQRDQDFVNRVFWHRFKARDASNRSQNDIASSHAEYARRQRMSIFVQYDAAVENEHKRHNRGNALQALWHERDAEGKGQDPKRPMDPNIDAKRPPDLDAMRGDTEQ